MNKMITLYTGMLENIKVQKDTSLHYFNYLHVQYWGKGLILFPEKL